MKKVIALDPTTGRLKQTGNVVEETDVSRLAAPSKIPLADLNGKLDPNYLPSPQITVREQDGFPAVTTVSEIVVGNGDLSYLGGTAVRIKTASDSVGGGGGALAVSEQDGIPSVENVTEIVLPNDSLADLGGGRVQITFPKPEGGPEGQATITFNGDGSTRTFFLPNVQPVGLAVYLKRVDGSIVELVEGTDYETVGAMSGDIAYERRATATQSGGSNPSYAFDANDSTAWGIGYNYGWNWVQIDLGTPRNVVGARTIGNDWGSPIHIRASNTSDFSGGWAETYAGRLKANYAWVSPGTFRYWRLYFESGGGVSLNTWELYELGGTSITAVVLNTAPATGEYLIVSYFPDNVTVGPLAVADVGGGLTVEGVSEIRVPDGSLTDLGDGVVRLDVSTGSGGGGGPGIIADTSAFPQPVGYGGGGGSGGGTTLEASAGSKLYLWSNFI